MHFTPWTSLTGGLNLGVAPAMFIFLNVRILETPSEKPHSLETPWTSKHSRLICRSARKSWSPN
jgi:hypothetical protein